MMGGMSTTGTGESELSLILILNQYHWLLLPEFGVQVSGCSRVCPSHAAAPNNRGAAQVTSAGRTLRCITAQGWSKHLLISQPIMPPPSAPLHECFI